MVRWPGVMLAGVMAVGGAAAQSAPVSAGAVPAQGTTAQQGPAAAVSTLQTPAVSVLLTTPVAQLSPRQIEGMQRDLADWPELGRYKAENAKLGPPAAGEKRVVFYGDSITDSWGRRYGRFFPDQPWVNRGISGQTTPQMLLRFHQDVIALQPEAVVILAGINDIAGNTGAETLAQIETNYRTMVQLAKDNHIRVVVSSVLPASQLPWRPGADPRQEVVALNQWLQTFAAEQGLVYLDYYGAMLGPDGGMKPELAADRYIHPNDAGYAVMEPLARAAVQKSLAQPRP